jgi:phosphoenolpyruvate carboxykinase (GTP)
MPKYQDVARLFKDELGKEYSRAEYVQQFSIRIPENLAKLDRVEDIYRQKVPDTPDILYGTFAEVRDRLKSARGKHGDCISPFDLTGD